MIFQNLNKHHHKKSNKLNLNNNFFPILKITQIILIKINYNNIKKHMATIIHLTIEMIIKLHKSSCKMVQH